MFKKIARILSDKDLQNKILFTMIIILIYRFGTAIAVPFVDANYISKAIKEAGSFFGYLDVLSGGGLSKATIFAMSISPYINASIIMQLLAVAMPSFEKLQKEGEFGRKKLMKYTRYLTITIATIQGLGYYVLLRRFRAIKYVSGFDGIFAAVVIIIALTSGTAFIVWLGERISEKGIGNGISIILFAGIVSRVPSAIGMLWKMGKLGIEGQYQYYFMIPTIVFIFLSMVVIIVIMHLAERRIPIQYAKRIVGRKMFAGRAAHIPIKISMSGVMPIIFASSILGIPSMIGAFVDFQKGSMIERIFSWFRYDSWNYAILYFILIIVFNFFYVSIQYNPVEISNNLVKSGGLIPGIRPGKPTSTFISKVIWKIAFVGAIVLAIIAIFPIIFTKFTAENFALGGTSIIILVGVALETVRVIESQVTMQKHKGFLE